MGINRAEMRPSLDPRYLRQLTQFAIEISAQLSELPTESTLIICLDNGGLLISDRLSSLHQKNILHLSSQAIKQLRSFTNRGEIPVTQEILDQILESSTSTELKSSISTLQKMLETKGLKNLVLVDDVILSGGSLVSVAQLVNLLAEDTKIDCTTVVDGVPDKENQLFGYLSRVNGKVDLAKLLYRYTLPHPLLVSLCKKHDHGDVAQVLGWLLDGDKKQQVSRRNRWRVLKALKNS